MAEKIAKVVEEVANLAIEDLSRVGAGRSGAIVTVADDVRLAPKEDAGIVSPVFARDRPGDPREFGTGAGSGGMDSRNGHSDRGGAGDGSGGDVESDPNGRDGPQIYGYDKDGNQKPFQRYQVPYRPYLNSHLVSESRAGLRYPFDQEGKVRPFSDWTGLVDDWHPPRFGALEDGVVTANEGDLPFLPDGKPTLWVMGDYSPTASFDGFEGKLAGGFREEAYLDLPKDWRTPSSKFVQLIPPHSEYKRTELWLPPSMMARVVAGDEGWNHTAESVRYLAKNQAETLEDLKQYGYGRLAILAQDNPRVVLAASNTGEQLLMPPGLASRFEPAVAGQEFATELAKQLGKRVTVYAPDGETKLAALRSPTGKQFRVGESERWSPVVALNKDYVRLVPRKGGSFGQVEQVKGSWWREFVGEPPTESS